MSQTYIDRRRRTPSYGFRSMARPMLKTTTVTPRASRRGFTLVELLIVVAMVGIFAALAIVGYRKYMYSAQASEASGVIQAIRAGQEAYRAETLNYLSCFGGLDTLHPRALADLDNKKASFQPDPADTSAIANCWRLLNVTTDSPVRFTYGIESGAPGGAAPPASDPNGEFAQWPNFPTTPTEPWFVVVAYGDRDEDGTYARFLGSSFTGELYYEEDTE